MAVPIILWGIGALFGLAACGSSATARSDDARTDDREDGCPDRTDASEDTGSADGPISPADAGTDQYLDGNSRADACDGGEGEGDGGRDGGDGGIDRTGINDSYAPLPFCSGRNIFAIQSGRGVGFCGSDPSTLYSFPISDDLSSVESSSLMSLPETIGSRGVAPASIRFVDDAKVILPMSSSLLDNAASFLLIDISAEAFIAQQVSATSLQIGRNPIGDTLPIAGLDIALIGSEFWGVLSNPNEDGTYRYGFGLALPQTEEGLVDVGIEPNEEGVVESILSNRIEGIGDDAEPGSHFSFRTTDEKPTNVEDLGGRLVAIQNSGTDDTPASIDVATDETHQLLESRNISLGMRELSVLPRLAVDAAATRVYPATATSLWEVDVSEGAPSEQENEMPLADDLGGQIASALVLGSQIIVGDSDGQILFVDLSDAGWGTVSRTIDVGSDLSWVAADASGNLFAAVGATTEEDTPHIVSINPALLD